MINQNSFLPTLANIRGIAKKLHRSVLFWEAFVKYCKFYGIPPMTIRLDIAVGWNSTFFMLGITVFLRKAIQHLVEDYSKELGEFKLSDYEWELADVLLVFLMPFQHCTKRFECQHISRDWYVLSCKTNSDYVFFAYDTLYNNLDDVKAALVAKEGLGCLPRAVYLNDALTAMAQTLKEYYTQSPD